MKISSKKGFTLIELLVVIAIIGILASVVLASLNTARSKGNNAKIKAQLSGARAGAEIFYDIGQTYTGLCAATDPVTYPYMAPYLLNTNYPGSATVNCFPSAGAYPMAVQLTAAEGTNTYWCIDSAGSSKGTIGLTIGAADFTC